MRSSQKPCVKFFFFFFLNKRHPSSPYAALASLVTRARGHQVVAWLLSTGSNSQAVAVIESPSLDRVEV